MKIKTDTQKKKHKKHNREKKKKGGLKEGYWLLHSGSNEVGKCHDQDQFG